jgi:acyl-CoA reductase-like NAD-dependent aldehyde dehydrogenase
LFGPFIGAIDGGCTTVLNPSDTRSTPAMVLKKLIQKIHFDCFGVANGDKYKTARLNEKWDKVSYTGNSIE